MNSGQLDNLVTVGIVKKEAPDRQEFDGLVESGRKRLADAHRNELSRDSRFDLAYGAAHAFSLAAMRYHGYRPDKQRFIVFQALEHTLGIKPEHWRVLDKCHRLRNLTEYEGSFEVDEQLLTELLKVTDLLQQAVERLDPPK